MGKLDAIPDWWSMLLPWVRKYHGEHVISLPMYGATSDPMDFWLSPDRLRLVELALTTILSTIGHGQSRSTSHLFREWFALQVQLDRSVQLQHIPSNTLIHATLFQDTRSAATRRCFSQISRKPWPQCLLGRSTKPGAPSSTQRMVRLWRF
jgi:hypothetical protein